MVYEHSFNDNYDCPNTAIDLNGATVTLVEYYTACQNSQCDLMCLFIYAYDLASFKLLFDFNHYVPSCVKSLQNETSIFQSLVCT